MQSREFKYVEIANIIREAIVQGEFEVGRRLPGQRELSRVLQANRLSNSLAV